MTSAESHLLQILNDIFNPNVLIDQKSKFILWIKLWICGKKTANEVFRINDDNDNGIINDNDDDDDNNNNNNNHSSEIKLLNALHTNFHAKYSKCYFIYDHDFINDVLHYVEYAYLYLFKRNSEQLYNCLLLLRKLDQNFKYSSNNIYNEQYPDNEKCKQAFENYGRAFFDYYNNRKIPFIIQTILQYPQIEFLLDYDNNNNNNNNNNKEKIFIDNLYNLIKLIVSDEKKDWLEFLHGPLINVNHALYHHRTFVKKYFESVNSNCLLYDFIKYLNQMYECVFHEKYLKEIPEISFPTILKFNNNDDNDNNKIKIKDYYNINSDYKQNIEYILNQVPKNETYKYVISTILPSLRVKVLGNLIKNDNE